MVSHNPTRSKPTPQPVGPYEAWKPGAAADSSQQVADPTAHLSKDTVKALRGHEVPTTSSNHPVGVERKAYHQPRAMDWSLESGSQGLIRA